MSTESKDPLLKIKQLTTSLGIYQFGAKDKPDPLFGYALDDQARALIVAHGFNNTELKNIYKNYIIKSKRADGLLYQFMDKDGNFTDNGSEKDTKSSQDAYGETIWAILKTNSEANPEIKIILDNLLSYAKNWRSLRPISYALLGLTNLLQPTILEQNFTQILIESFNSNSGQSWQWFEKQLTYANPVIPWALWKIFIARKDEAAKKVADETTRFLIETCNINGIPFPVGNKGWYEKNQGKEIYDQQPIDASYMVCCLEKAYQVTNDRYYFEWAKKWWGWFWGNNTQKIPLIDDNFVCYDGLMPHGVNLNQSAESNICFLMAYLSAKRMALPHTR